MAKEYTRKVTILFKEIKTMDPELKRDLHFQMKKLIRLHFIDDEVETRRLLTMITEAIQTDKLDELTTFQKAMQKIEKQTEELYEKNKEIKHKNKTIENKDKEIKHKNKTIENKDEEIEKLKEILNSHNIKY